MPQNAANLETAPFGIPVANATGDALTSITLTDGQVIIGDTGGQPVAATLTAGANITLTPGPGSIEVAAAGGGGGDVAWISVNTVTFTSSDTYIPPAGLIFALITASAGGSGGQAASTNSIPIVLRGAGDAGGVGQTIRTAAQIGASAAVTIGAGSVTGNGGMTSWIDDLGTLSLVGGTNASGPLDPSRSSATLSGGAGANSPVGTWASGVLWASNSQPGGWGVGIVGATHVKGVLSNGGQTFLGVSPPTYFMLEPAGVNFAWDASAAEGLGSSSNGNAVHRVSGTVTATTPPGTDGAIIVTEFIGP